MAITANRGFTLLEVLVVLVIVAVMASMVTVSVGDNPQRALVSEASRLQQVLQLASQEAVLQGQELGLALSGNRYQVLQFDPRVGEWGAPSERLFQRYNLPPNIQLAVHLENSANAIRDGVNTPLLGADKPAVLILSSGESTPFTLRLQQAETDAAVELVSDGVSGVYLR